MRIVGFLFAKIPFGLNTIIKTIAPPKAIILYCSKSLNISVIPIKKIDARTTPVCEPIPPNTTIATMIADSINVKLSGLINACRVAKNEPAKPPNIAPIAKAVNFVFVGFTPKDLQAISSSLKASQALPTGSFLIFSVK